MIAGCRWDKGSVRCWWPRAVLCGKLGVVATATTWLTSAWKAERRQRCNANRHGLLQRGLNAARCQQEQHRQDGHVQPERKRLRFDGGHASVDATKCPVSKSMLVNATLLLGCCPRCTDVRAVHLLSNCPRAAACASSSHRLLSACEACPLVQDQVVLCRAFCSSSSCHKS